MPSRSNFPMPDKDRDPARRPEPDPFEGFDEDPLVELARIVNEGGERRSFESRQSPEHTVETELYERHPVHRQDELPPPVSQHGYVAEGEAGRFAVDDEDRAYDVYQNAHNTGAFDGVYDDHGQNAPATGEGEASIDGRMQGYGQEFERNDAYHAASHDAYIAQENVYEDEIGAADDLRTGGASFDGFGERETIGYEMDRADSLERDEPLRNAASHDVDPYGVQSYGERGYASAPAEAVEDDDYGYGRESEGRVEAQTSVYQPEDHSAALQEYDRRQREEELLTSEVLASHGRRASQGYVEHDEYRRAQDERLYRDDHMQEEAFAGQERYADVYEEQERRGPYQQPELDNVLTASLESELQSALHPETSAPSMGGAPAEGYADDYPDQRLRRSADEYPVEAHGGDENLDDLFAEESSASLNQGEGEQYASYRGAYREDDDLDDMEWPAAEQSLRGSVDERLTEEYDEEYDAPPPPEGYDLDAVARAMRDSDPTLQGHGVLSPHAMAEEQAAPEGKNGRGIKIAAIVAGVVVLGGVGLAAMSLGGGDTAEGPAKTVMADEGPLKVYPEAGASGAKGGAKLSYNRVGGVEDSAEERLVLPENTPVASLPPAPDNSDVRSATDNSAVSVSGPRKVRTVVVRPDGTIISGKELDTVGEQTPSAQPSVNGADANAPRAVGTVDVSPQSPNASREAVAVVAPPAAPAPAQPAVDGSVPRAKPASVPAQNSQAQPRQTAAAVPSAPQASAPMNLTQPIAPTNEAASAPASAPQQTAAATSIPAGAYLVQVTSQRSESQARAAYESLQRKYSSVLGGVSPVIQRADLGDQGTFYRVRIAAGSRDAAIQLCENLKAAGGDCFVRRN